MVVDDTNVDKKSEVGPFFNHMSKAWEELYTLTDLEHKYPFFRLRTPKVIYISNILSISNTSNTKGKDFFQMFLDYELKLLARSPDEKEYEKGYEKGYVSVHFRVPHNYLLLNHEIGGSKTMKMEAQEEIMCDSNQGYAAVRNLFRDKGLISKNDMDYSIHVNDDMLLFDDRSLRHEVFRGWTGGYVAYREMPADIGKYHRKIKKKWDAAPYYESLEKRINTMKMLFDDINSYAKFSVDQTIHPIKKIPDFKSIYQETLNSERYKSMQNFGSILAQKAGFKPSYTVGIIMSGGMPRIEFSDRKNAVSFLTENTANAHKHFCCEVHIPLSGSKAKAVSKGVHPYLRYNQLELGPFNPLYIPKDEEMMGTFEYVNLVEDMNAGLEICLNRLL